MPQMSNTDFIAALTLTALAGLFVVGSLTTSLTVLASITSAV